MTVKVYSEATCDWCLRAERHEGMLGTAPPLWGIMSVPWEMDTKHTYNVCPDCLVALVEFVNSRRP